MGDVRAYIIASNVDALVAHCRLTMKRINSILYWWIMWARLKSRKTKNTYRLNSDLFRQALLRSINWSTRLFSMQAISPRCVRSEGEASPNYDEPKVGSGSFKIRIQGQTRIFVWIGTHFSSLDNIMCTLCWWINAKNLPTSPISTEQLPRRSRLTPFFLRKYISF